MGTLRPLSRSLEQRAILELNEVPQRILIELKELKRLLLSLPHLNARLDDQLLLGFLRNCKHDINLAMKKIEMFYTCRTALPQLMEDRDPLDPRVLEILRLGVGLPLPLTHQPDSPRIILIRVGAYESTKYSIIDIMKVANMICDVLLYEDDNIIISGEIAIVDFKYVTKGHLLQLQPSLVKKLSTLNQEGTPIKPVGIHYVHTPPGFDVVFNVFKNLTQNATNENDQLEIVIHPHTHETLFNHIPPEILPLEYGGFAGPLDCIVQFWEQKLIAYRDFFLTDGQYGTDESMRPSELRHLQFGFDEID